MKNIFIVFCIILLFSFGCKNNKSQSKTEAVEQETVMNEGNNRSMQLISAVKSANIEDVKSLLASGADINTKNGYGRTPLLSAYFHNQPQAMVTLIKNGADVNVKDYNSKDF